MRSFFLLTLLGTAIAAPLPQEETEIIITDEPLGLGPPTTSPTISEDEYTGDLSTLESLPGFAGPPPGYAPPGYPVVESEEVYESDAPLSFGYGGPLESLVDTEGDGLRGGVSSLLSGLTSVLGNLLGGLTGRK